MQEASTARGSAYDPSVKSLKSGGDTDVSFFPDIFCLIYSLERKNVAYAYDLGLHRDVRFLTTTLDGKMINEVDREDFIVDGLKMAVTLCLLPCRGYLCSIRREP
jgi:hypothetical protein